MMFELKFRMINVLFKWLFFLYVVLLGLRINFINVFVWFWDLFIVGLCIIRDISWFKLWCNYVSFNFNGVLNW